MTTTADVLSARAQSSKHRRCASCAKPLSRHRRKGAAPKHCQTERCRKSYYSGAQRTKCQRCSNPLARGRAAQRAAICGRCFVDLLDLAGGEAR